MARVITQNIPSEYEKLYGEIARPAFEMFPGSGKYYSQRRYPFRLPAHPRIGFVDGTAKQHAVRQIFLQCAKCFNWQPYSGGASPPAIGPRNRSLWYSEAAGSGLWYYDYFMQQTLNSHFGGTVPNWCLATNQGDAYVLQRAPHDNTGSSTQYRITCGGTDNTYLYLKFDTSHMEKNVSGTLYLYIEYCFIPTIQDYVTLPFTIYRVIENWGEYTVRWNDQPALGEIVGYISHTFGPRYTGWNFADVLEYRPFPIRNLKACTYGICIKTEPCANYSGPLGYTRQYTNPAKRPYISS